LVDVNVIGTLNCAARAIKPMLAQGSGSIVNLTSNTHMGSPPYGIYAATKGAVASLVYTWAMELAGSGIRVNALSPFGATRMVLASFDDEAEAQRVHAAFPRPEANSPVIEFLLSDAAADVNGQMVLIRGQEVYLYAHPALLLPPAVRSKWTAETLADAFAKEFRGRLVPCGDAGMAHQPVDLEGNWTRAARS
jgi:short-subunit dehydrogenase